MAETREWKSWDKFTFVRIDSTQRVVKGSGMVLPDGQAMLKMDTPHSSWVKDSIPSNAKLETKGQWTSWGPDLEVAAFVERLLKEQRGD